jgi:hypothetical protein
METLRIFLFILIIIGLVLLFTEKIWVPKLINKIIEREFGQTEVSKPVIVPISITSKKIKEENFSATFPVISGTSKLAVSMQEFIDKNIADFKKQADQDVPSMRAQFGAYNPTANYEIFIDSKYIKGEKTESIATEVYTYTGGAHGSTLYKVMTANLSDGAILSLANIIKKEKQNNFVEFVKGELKKKYTDEVTGSYGLFDDSLKALTFNSFNNWSMDGQNLIIYFDQYAIGPGALGATEFAIPLTGIKDFLL